ncbi:hypothetical protein GCM10010259_05710 [Streptomyces daghestanicus]|uniref:Uncharacterized protein n=1 Tax=Streptomyces daghestanicus TaxID=66885 RepID=A0ABQ3Q8Z7_9ACTN|nr:hypothetical protein GCM10010259_05710 [Streptomyces daghestanicus]GHI33738.1 hypothetical protein Sdagh_54680 [Streptomyces daghestanicus]
MSARTGRPGTGGVRRDRGRARADQETEGRHRQAGNPPAASVRRYPERARRVSPSVPGTRPPRQSVGTRNPPAPGQSVSTGNLRGASVSSTRNASAAAPAAPK